MKFSSKLSLGRWRLSSLDTLGVDLREVDFSGGRIGFGRYVGNKTYVSVSQELANDHGREVAVEYEGRAKLENRQHDEQQRFEGNRYYLEQTVLRLRRRY